ncbi:hypothetical protein EDD36DRAFT_420957 [Exophiala viscosa]|uniref:Transcription factor domain-containing protein n=1 Tax=Exophiala viscosa TaxID=2486360 RepID=A0AAN6DQZ0_9EURO|nr:hypothetical protein EDD36DRAFT_420957 [Exophiala viscosa]
MPPGSSTRMMFIVSSNVEKVDPVVRKQIRSHVMRGKRQKKYQPEDDKRATSLAKTGNRVPKTPANLEQVMRTYAPLVPRTILFDLSFAADEIDALMALRMVDVSMIATRVMFPLMRAIGSQADGQESCPVSGRPIISHGPVDAAALHIAAFAVYGFIDRILRRQDEFTNPAAMLHFQKGLKLLRERLLRTDDEMQLSDSTIGAVAKLASHAHFEGDSQASKQHMEGLRKMVDLRGGLDVFNGNKLLMEMLRCDLGIALHNGSKPVFFRQPSEPVPGYPETLLRACNDEKCPQDNVDLLRDMDHDLATAWRIMRRFCLLVNLGTQIQRLIHPEIIVETMTAVTYRLLYMNFITGSVDEVIRLGLLAFCHHIFLQWQDIRLPYYRFPTGYRNRILGVKPSQRLSPQVVLWLMMTGAISLYDTSEESWLRESLRDYADRCQVKSWKEMQETLKCCMWVVLLDDQPGRQIYNLLYHDKDKI